MILGGLAALLLIIGFFSAPPILILQLRKRSKNCSRNDGAAAMTPPSFQPNSFVLGSSVLFKLVGVTAVTGAIFGALVWSSATAIHDSAGSNGALVFLSIDRSIKLFIRDGMVGCIGPRRRR